MDPLRAAMGRERMVRRLIERGIADPRVLRAMAEVPRERFVDPAQVDDAYADSPLPIAGGQTISQPWIVAFMTQALELAGDERTLEVGAGSGYGAAVLSRCCREVVAIERLADLARAAAARLAELGYDNVEVRWDDGALGAPDRAPFGGISVAAMSSAPPAALVAQLAPGAAMVCPVGEGGRGDLVRVRGGRLERLVPAGFVPLIPGALGEDPAGG
jgi:protein-L-isoaspartate(D-aspartate) O-methyltransferase